MRKLTAALLVGLAIVTTSCATRTPGPGSTPTEGPPAPVDDPWPGRYRYVSTQVTQAGQPRALVGVAYIELDLTTVGSVSVYAGCNILSTPVRLNGARMWVGEVSSTKKACLPDLMAQDDWLRMFLEADPSVPSAGVVLVLQSADVVITLEADLSPS
jgi:heat shock protein HslJ